MRERILALALEITGRGEETQTLLETLCIAAEATWRARLREGVAAEDYPEAFCCAAALTAAADVLVSRGGDGVASFTAGEISIQGKGSSNGVAQADALRRSAERLMAPYVAAADFCFKGVWG